MTQLMLLMVQLSSVSWECWMLREDGIGVERRMLESKESLVSVRWRRLLLDQDEEGERRHREDRLD